MTEQNFSEHGEFVPDYKVQVNYEPWRERMVIYIKMGMFKDGHRLYRQRVDPMYEGRDTELAIVAPAEEPPLYLVLGEQEAEAIADAIRSRPQVNERHLDDAITMRDRLMTIVESNMMMGMNETDKGVQHMIVDADLRRHPQVRVR